jgi:hypothetical protein
LATNLATKLASFQSVTAIDEGQRGSAEPRKRGGVRRHGNGFQVRVSAGTDPSTGERIVLYETVPIAPARTKAAQERAEREARMEAGKILTRR